MSDFIDTLPKDAPIVLYGAGWECSYYIDVWMKTERVVAACYGDDKHPQEYYGLPVITPKKLVLDKNRIVVVATYKYRMEILHDLDEIGYPMENVFCAPYVGEAIDNIGQYFDPHIIRFSHNEIFVDGGCLDLSTSLELRKRVPNVKACAFEADPENYERCLEVKKRSSFDKAEIIPYGLWDCSSEIRFSSTGDGSSSISEKGDTVIRVKALDDVICDENITFIKMDIEGAEIKALKGAKKTIQRCRPKIAISLYHKPDDLITIPSLIMEYVNDYKYYIRCYNNGETEMVLYAVPSS